MSSEYYDPAGAAPQSITMTAHVNNDGANIVYDAQPHGISVIVSGVSSGYTVRYSTAENGPFTDAQPRKVNVADSGRIYYEVTHPDRGKVSGYGTVNIIKRAVTVKAQNTKLTFTGKTLECQSKVVMTAGGHGLVSGHVANGESAGSGVTPGTYELVIQKLRILSGTVDVTQNYDITKLPGVVRIEKSKLSIRVGNAAKKQGTPDKLTYPTSFSGGTLCPGDTFSSLMKTFIFYRKMGEVLGRYEINILNNHPMYNFYCIPGTLTIR